MPPNYHPRPCNGAQFFRPGPWIADHSGAGRFAGWSVGEGLRVRLLRAAVLSVCARWRGGHGRGDGFDNAWAGVCGRVQDVDDGAGTAERAEPGGKLHAVVILDL